GREPARRGWPVAARIHQGAGRRDDRGVEVAAVLDRSAEPPVGTLQADREGGIDRLLDADRRLVLVRRLQARIDGVDSALEDRGGRRVRVLREGRRAVVEVRDDRGGHEYDDGQLRRNRIVEPSDRAVELRRAVAGEVPRDSETRRPLVGQREGAKGSRDRIVALVPFGVVPQAHVYRQRRQDPPLVLETGAQAPDRDVERRRRKDRGVRGGPRGEDIVLEEDLPRFPVRVHPEGRPREVADRRAFLQARADEEDVPSGDVVRADRFVSLI